MRVIASILLLTLLLAACGSESSTDPDVTASKDDDVGDVAVDAGGDAASEEAEPTPTPSASDVSDQATDEPTPESAATPTAEPDAPEPTEPAAPPTEGLPGGRYVKIDAIRAEGQSYAVDFTPYNFAPLIGSGPQDFHVHFFWDTLEPQNAGTNGPSPGSWVLYDGPPPFTEYTFADRPPAATQMCALVADSAHGVTLDSGNCVTLP